jgi:tetratricopeptide (TPR) repeat protein
MFVFLRLLDAAGSVVTRAELFDECWGGAIVGDDSLNRAVRGARQVATGVGSTCFSIEAIPRTGYVLTLAPGVRLVELDTTQSDHEAKLQSAVEDAYDCWRTGLPTPDVQAIRALDLLLSDHIEDARAWGMYALLLRKAAEYAEHDECAHFVRACEQAARRAYSLQPNQSDAAVALTGVVPLFGNWSAARTQLTAVREAEPDHVPAAHDLAVLEMATGRPSRARPLVEDLIARDPLAATFYYKRMYHLWTFGELAGMDQIAARALQLWPRHPAIWTARIWTLVFTGRAAQALQLLNDREWGPPMPKPAVELLRGTCRIVAGQQAGQSPNQSCRDEAVANAVAAASRGPAQAVAALMSLCAMDAIDEAFDVAYGYYLGRGSAAAPLRRNAGDPSITDQHRRVTQPLFIPAAERMREDRRFAALCSDIGLTAYWDHFGIAPDFAAQ